MKHSIVIILILFISQLHGMQFDIHFKLSPIEKGLVLGEIEESGLFIIEQKVNNTQDQKHLDNGFTIVSPALIIERRFKRKHTKTDQLTRTVFDTISTIESTIEEKTKPKAYGCLQRSINYYWLNDAKSKVLLVSRVENKPGVQKIISKYKQQKLMAEAKQ